MVGSAKFIIFKISKILIKFIDLNGNICSGTSTGGILNKRFGRVGDTPMIGSGTYAKNSTCAISGTGEGEKFIRL